MKKEFLHILLFTLAAAFLLSGCGGRRTHSFANLGGMASSGESAQSSQSEHSSFLGAEPAGETNESSGESTQPSQSENSSFLGTEPAGETSVAGTYELDYIYFAPYGSWETPRRYVDAATGSDFEGEPWAIAPEDEQTALQQIAEECILLREDGTGELRSPLLLGVTGEILWRLEGDVLSLQTPEGEDLTLQCQLKEGELTLWAPDYGDAEKGFLRYSQPLSIDADVEPLEASEVAGTYAFTGSIYNGGRTFTWEESLEAEKADGASPEELDEMEKAAQAMMNSSIVLREDGTGEYPNPDPNVEQPIEIVWQQEGYIHYLHPGYIISLLPSGSDSESEDEELLCLLNGDELRVMTDGEFNLHPLYEIYAKTR